VQIFCRLTDGFKYGKPENIEDKFLHSKFIIFISILNSRLPRLSAADNCGRKIFRGGSRFLSLVSGTVEK
jgi:hypothetical protein